MKRMLLTALLTATISSGLLAISALTVRPAAAFGHEHCMSCH
jgi:hypothetical protein